ncbi:MAG TPA: DUF6502 family protein, partial [Nitrospiria bacterium]|nr:DUF6502 family protein [Nitrospiria bacterium]
MNQALLAATLKLLKPLVRILLRNGVPYGIFSDLAKRVFIEIAADEFGIAGRKQTVSRISILTGINRKEVGRVKNLPDTEHHNNTADRYNRAGRVIAAWRRESRYLDSRRNPAVLKLEGSGASFSNLVREFSGDVPARAILDELLRVNAVERVGENRVRLLVQAYIPRTDQTELLNILGTAAKDLIATIDHNLGVAASGSADGYFQRAVSYNNLPAEAIPGFRTRSYKNAQKLLELLDRWLSTKDRD